MKEGVIVGLLFSLASLVLAGAAFFRAGAQNKQARHEQLLDRSTLWLTDIQRHYSAACNLFTVREHLGIMLSSGDYSDRQLAEQEARAKECFAKPWDVDTIILPKGKVTTALENTERIVSIFWGATHEKTCSAEEQSEAKDAIELAKKAIRDEGTRW